MTSQTVTENKITRTRACEIDVFYIVSEYLLGRCSKENDLRFSRKILASTLLLPSRELGNMTNFSYQDLMLSRSKFELYDNFWFAMAAFHLELKKQTRSVK